MNSIDYSPIAPILGDKYITILICTSGILGLLFALYQYLKIRKIKIYEYGHSFELLENQRWDREKLINVYEAISEGAAAFLKEEFKYMYIFIILFAGIITILVGSAGNCGKSKIIDGILQSTDGSCWIRGGLTAGSFVVGGLTSMLSGYIGMRIAVYTNARTTISATRGWGAAFNTAFSGGAVMGFCLCSLGLLILYVIINLYHLYWDLTVLGNGQALFECIAGYGLGGSSIALFGRVGGGIYTKAADVGADLVGKVEQGIPEDDPRNPAVIADNVGDNVGDVAGMGADLFGSFAEATCAALVIASMSPDLNKYWGSLLFPLLITSVGIFSGFLTALIPIFYKVKKEADIEKSLKIQLIMSTLLTTPLIAMISYLFLPSKFCVELSDNITDSNFIWDDDMPSWCSHKATNTGAFISIICGLWSGLIIGYFTEYMTSHSHYPVRELASVCDKGAAVNIIYGLALGNFSTIVPVIFLAITILISFQLASMFGIALAALGMLSTLTIGLTIDVYGPISDNAGGIAEMVGFDESVRAKTDALDAAGNTTAAIGKGFAIGSAALVSLALFGAFVSRAGLGYQGINILDSFTFFGLLIGAMLPYVFSAMTMKSVGKAAQEMVEEVRRQFRENPGIMQGNVKPDYKRCVEISTQASLKEMILPGILVIFTPIVFGFLFGIKALSGLLTGSLISGVQMAISSSNTGGAWDNAKKYIEKGNYGGKGSAAHSAAVTGDTVGDPLKDTSGPALNILMKLMAIISLVFADFFVKNSLPSLIPRYTT
jgi:H+-translocating diphosphatase